MENVFLLKFHFDPRSAWASFRGPGAEKLDFEEIGVASLELDPAPREERERRAGSFRKLST